ncbi:MAG TPA: hypothetical protein PKL77_00820 [Candidatus Omnitrophota bacterium]|nr:hypothetical protein [Candidatus Omnitrophota bacterium]HPT06534.1 hypothetical protein [Candidatus Omnitrophota bacterium]
MTKGIPMNVTNRKKGIALFMVLMTILIVSLLANIVLNMMLGQGRSSRHQISRTQAYYAGLAAMNWARANLQSGRLTYAPVNSCPNNVPCVFVDPNGALPPSINNVRVIFCPANANCQGDRNTCRPPNGIDFCIQAITDYTLAP